MMRALLLAGCGVHNRSALMCRLRGLAMAFNGFISYSHTADGRLAPAIQRGLHQLAKPWHRRRALWIFRDQTGLSVTPGLWSSIQRALDGSDWFVLLASPEAARSPWVNREIEHWVTTKPVGRILPVLTEGVWRWDAQRGDFSEDSSAVPGALRGAFAEEPLFLDLRWARDDLQLNLRHSRFRDAIAQLAAPMHGVSKDELEGEDVRQHRRMRRLRSVAAAVVLMLMLVASAAGLIAQRNGQRATVATSEAARQHQSAVTERVSALRFAGEAKRQEQDARKQEARASAAAAETVRQGKLAAGLKLLAVRASGEAARAQENVRTQQTRADTAAARAREQERFADQQRAAAREAGLESAQQKQIAQEQQQAAAESAVVARRQEQNAKDQQRLAQQAAADAKWQEQNAKNQQRLAEEAATEARKQTIIAKKAAAEARGQKSNAEGQQRIAIGRRLTNQAKAIAAQDMRTALMLEAAAVKVQADDEARSNLAGLVTSTRYAGAVDRVRDAAYISDDVLVTENLENILTLCSATDRANPTVLASLGRYDRWGVSPAGRAVAAASWNDRSSVVLFDVTNPSKPHEAARIPIRSQVFNLTFSPDGRTLFVGATNEADKDVGDLWDVSDMGRPKLLVDRFDGLTNVVDAAFSPNGNTLVTMFQIGLSGPDVNSIGVVWDLTRAAEVGRADRAATLDKALDGKRQNTMAFLPDAPILVTGGAQATMLIDLSKPANPKRVFMEYNLLGETASSILVSSDGRRLITGFREGLVTVSERLGAGLVEVDSWTDPRNRDPMALSPDGRTLVTGSTYDYTATLWNVAANGRPQSRGDITDRGRQGMAAVFTPDGRSMLTIGTSPQAAVWDMTGSAPVQSVTPTVHDRAIDMADVTPDGRIVAAGDRSGRVTVTDLTDPSRPVTVARFQQATAWQARGNEVAISPDGRTVAVAGKIGEVVLWDVTRGRVATPLGPPLTGVRMPVAFSPAARTFAIVNEATTEASLWTLDGPTGPARLAALGSARIAEMVEALAFSPDGHTVAMAGTSTVDFWDVSQTRPRPSGRLTDPGGVTSLAFSPDGRTLATTAFRNTMRLWDLTGGADRVKVADFQTPVGAIPYRRVNAAFSRDGRTLVTGETGFGPEIGAVALWDLTKLAELRANPDVQACVMAGRGLTEDEWGRYVPELPYQRTCPD